MKKNAILLKSILIAAKATMLLLLLSSCNQETYNPALTEQFALQSETTGDTYQITVGLPADYNPAVEKYATVYVLDGEEDFDYVSNQCRTISDQYAVPNVVVVSIGYGADRSIDYTPTKVSSVTGGGAAFLQFIETQLIPEIETHFAVDTTRYGRVILGHSYGGLFGAYAFSVKNQLFGNYILLSPSLWFDNLVTLQFEKDNRSAIQDSAQLVFLGIGEAENSGRMQAPFEAFYQSLHDNYSDIKLEKNREPHLSHLGSKHPNIDKGLNFYFQNR